MGRADLAVVLLARVEVVVVCVHAGGGQLLRLAVAEQAEAGADLQLGMGGLDRPDRPGEAVQLAAAGTAAAGHHAEALGSAGDRDRRRLDRLRRLQHPVAPDGRRREPGL